MRYEHWDVLLFPEGSRVPIQEFKTNCFVARDSESPYIQAQALLNPNSFLANNGFPGQIPVLTTFVPSLPCNSPFRVSVHSWKRPTPTRVMESLMQPEDSVVYEVRVFIDGICVSASFFNERAPGPHVIDLGTQLDRNGNQDSLRFPPFHEELLHQSHWDAGDMYGRIRVVIAEGFARPNRNPPFERVRDLIKFSYQHAPLAVLESSNIAWPNPGMWHQQPQPRHMMKYTMGHDNDSLKDDDAHSHSPTRHEIRQMASQNPQHGTNFPTIPYRLKPNLSASWHYNNNSNPWLDREGPWAAAPTPPISDPFVDPYRGFMNMSRRNRSTLEDVLMPDYIASTSTSSRAISNATGSSLIRNKEPTRRAPTDDEQYNELITALNGKKPPSAPTNTPMAAPNTSKKSVKTGSENQANALKELAQPTTTATRATSGSSIRSRNSLNEMPVRENSLLSPSPHVKSRKEGSISVYEDKENSSGGEVSPLSPSRKSSIKTKPRLKTCSTESKRKRSISSTHSRTTDHGSEKPSASKKVSRHSGQHEGVSQDEFEDFLTTHRPIIPSGSELGEVE
ncbi:hypothetical protein FQN57_006101 [Myotisia sp. PD_48]|nr:hypothetical protein FQN57_006101 [Myotisia sp. PD_48]